jgi:hypothetical protein
MNSFNSVYRQLLESQPLLAVGDMEQDELAAVEVVRRGMQLSNGNQSFWEGLRQLSCSNRSGLAKLLGVKPDVIARWPKIIGHYLSKITEINSHIDGQKKPQVIPTGNMPVPKVQISGTHGDSNIPSINNSPF